MSYDIEIGNYDTNFTSNMMDFFVDFGVYPRDMDGKYGYEVAFMIQKGLHKFIHTNFGDMEEKYNSPNKWGTVTDAIPFLMNLRDACLERHDMIVRVS